MDLIEKLKAEYYKELGKIDTMSIEELEHAYNIMAEGTEWEFIRVSEERMRELCVMSWKLSIKDQLTNFMKEIKVLV